MAKPDKTKPSIVAAAHAAADAHKGGQTPEVAPLPDAAVHNAIAAVRTGAVPSHASKHAGEPTVKMHFPRKVLLTLADHSRITFAEGIQDVPESLSGHDWLAKNGATLIEADIKEKPEE